MRILILALLSLLTQSIAVTLAHADPVRDSLAEVVKCTELTEGPARLACFDAATAKAKSALLAPPAPVAAPREKSVLEWFGFQKSQPVTKPDEFGKSEQPMSGELTEISSNVLEFAKTARGKALFVLDNGQVWRQIDGDTTEVSPPAPGTTMRVTIETGFLNSFNLLIAGRKGLVKATRLK
jgi:hypothetical protein